MLSPRKMKSSGLSLAITSRIGIGWSCRTQEPKWMRVRGLAVALLCAFSVGAARRRAKLIGNRFRARIMEIVETLMGPLAVLSPGKGRRKACPELAPARAAA